MKTLYFIVHDNASFDCSAVGKPALSCHRRLKKAGEAFAAKAKTSPCDWFTTILLAILGGSFGIHRFYVGKKETGLIWLLTGGILGVGTIYDVIMIAMGKFTDGNGLPIVKK